MLFIFKLNSLELFEMCYLKFNLLIFTFLILNTACQHANSLFQKDANDWNIVGDANWKYSGNELVATVENGQGFVITNQRYSDFILELDFNPDSTINSGIFIRCRNQEINPIDCYEVNIWDLHPNQDYRTGAIVMKSVPLASVETNYRWNTYKIRAEKDNIKVWINDILTADLLDSSRLDGFIGLQATGTGEIKFRNMKIKPL